MQHDKYIILYADDFDIDIWASYMDILELPHTEEKVKIGIANLALCKNTYNVDDFENIDEYLEEWVFINDKMT